jgi:BirA family biotin operon repressor/biotin-[acetyl-CoA-carboxylase] ligase
MRVKDSVAKILTDTPGTYHSGAALAEALGVSRNAIWKAIKQLQEEGFPIVSKKKTGYCLAQEADLLTEDTVTPYLRSRVLGQNRYIFPELDSTNNYCKQLMRQGVAHGTLVAANCQSAGKGRQGRTFCSPAGSGLYFSVLLAQSLPLQEAPLLTACAAVAVARAIDKLYGTKIQIKWVNDLFLEGKKCCGILTEGDISLESGCMEHAIVGIGINIRNTVQNLPKELQGKVTSLEEAIPGCHVRRGELLAGILYELEQALKGLPEKQFLPEYRSRSCLTGQIAEFVTDDGTHKKVAVLEIANDCGLVVRDTMGNVETLHAGEVHMVN